MSKFIEKCTEPQAQSFVDLKQHFLGKHPDPTCVCRKIKAPLWLVKKTTGTIMKITEALAFKYDINGIFLNIDAYKKNTKIAHFSIRKENKYDNKLINIIWGSFYTNNYELFLTQKEAVMRSEAILWKKKMKIDSVINALDTLLKEINEEEN